LSDFFNKMFQSVEVLIILRLTFIVSEYIQISPLNYVSVSAQKQ